MARKFGDLLPTSSGQSSIGVEMVNGGPTTTVSPFNQIHFGSGVLHDPLAGSSGVIRYKRNLGPNTDDDVLRGRIEFSGDGGNFFIPMGMQFSYLQSSSMYIAGEGNGGGGPVEITIGNRQLRLGSWDRRPLILLSGVVRTPPQANVRGSLWFGHHSAWDVDTSDYDESDAESLGPSVIAYNTGSGIIDVATCSGLTQAFVDTAVTITGGSQPFSVAVPLGDFDIYDRYYHMSSSGTIIAMIPGLYECYYNLKSDRSAGTTRGNMKSQALLGGGLVVPRSQSYVYARSSVAGEGNLSAKFLVNLNAGQEIGLATEVLGSPALGQDFVIRADESWMVMEYKGIRRDSSFRFAQTP